jgi:hypothetical protein
MRLNGGHVIGQVFSDLPRVGFSTKDAMLVAELRVFAGTGTGRAIKLKVLN